VNRPTESALRYARRDWTFCRTAAQRRALMADAATSTTRWGRAYATALLRLAIVRPRPVLRAPIVVHVPPMRLAFEVRS
jgi:hypothetical protein